MWRLLCGLALATLLTGSMLVAPAPAHANACTGASGVTVVVQDEEGGDNEDALTVACAPGDPASGLAALTSAGFSVEQVQSQPGAICTIDEKPSISCVRMPPGDHYWAFYHAAAGDSAWTYSTVGAANLDPQPGSSVGFRLGDGTMEPSRAPSSTTAAPSGSGDATATGQQEDGGDDGATVITAAIGGGLLAVLLGGAVVVARRRGL